MDLFSIAPMMNTTKQADESFTRYVYVGLIPKSQFSTMGDAHCQWLGTND